MNGNLIFTSSCLQASFLLKYSLLRLLPKPKHMSSPSKSVIESFAKGGNEWEVLDKVVSLAVNVATFLEGDIRCNDREVTLYLSKFEKSCGFTTEVSEKLFHKMNIRKRRQCANYGVTFVNADYCRPGTRSR